jgi:hypothetical protein
MKKTGLIIYLDALGTRGNWLRNPPEETIKDIEIIFTIAEGLSKIEQWNLLRWRYLHFLIL